MSSWNCADIFSQNWTDIFFQKWTNLFSDNWKKLFIRWFGTTASTLSGQRWWSLLMISDLSNTRGDKMSSFLHKLVHRWTNEFIVEQMSSALTNWAHRWTNEPIVEQMSSSLNKWVPFLTIEQRRQYAKALNFNTCFDQGLEYMSKINHLFLFSSFISTRWLVWM